jgi:hypothetical protein
MSAYADVVMRELFPCSDQPNLVMLNLFQHNAPPSPVILKQVQDDDIGMGVLNDDIGAGVLNDDIGVGVLKHVQDDGAGALLQ